MTTKYSGRQRTRFDEYRALKILQYFFPEQYSNLKLNESPDLQDSINQIGVEITSAIKGNIQESLSRVTSISGKTAEELNKNDKQNILKQRVHATQLPNGIYLAATHAFWGSCFDFKSSITKKLAKLNGGHFSQFKKNNLFLFAWMADDEDIAEGIQTIFEILSNNEFQFYFDTIYIYRENLLVEIDTHEKTVESHDMPDEVILSISEQAKTFISTKENL